MQGFQNFFRERQIDSQVVNSYMSRPDMSVSSIGKMHGLSEREVYRVLRFNHVSPNRKSVHHEKVQSLSRMGWGIKDIAEFTGYTTRNVRYILNKQLRENGSEH